MRKKVIITLLTLICVCCLSTSAILVAAEANSRSSESATWEVIDVSSDLTIGDSFDMPARSVSVDGKSYAATVKLVYPDGSTQVRTSEYPQAKLTLAGDYSLTFEARDESGTRYKDSVSFTVNDKLFKVSNSKSSVSYGAGALADSSKGATDGLLVSLVRGDSLTFGRVIDVSSITSDTVLVSGYIEPKDQGSADFDAITFTFTDVYNPEVTLSIRAGRSKGSEEFAKAISYWTAWGNDQVGSGYEGSKFHHGDGFGYPGQHSFSAMSGYWRTSTDNGSEPAPSNSNPFKVRYDPVTSQIFVGGTMVTDLDDPDLHASEPVWKGFKSDKVMLTVTVEGVSGESANFCLLSVYGYDDLSADNSFADTEAPVIAVDNSLGMLDENGNYAPKAVVGGSYPVLSATAFDEYAGDLSVSAEVYYNYSSETNRIKCAVKNGRFNVSYVGTYSVIYTAKDYFGNEAKKVCSVTSVKTLENPLAITIGGEKPTEASCGERVNLPGFSASGGSGDTNVVLTATLGNETITLGGNLFIPEKAGEWTITYTVSDVTNLTASESFKINVTAKSEPVFVDEVVMPKYLISGMSYVVPEVYANDYSSGEKTLVKAVLVLNGTEYNAGEKFTVPNVSDGEITTLTFKAGNSTKSYGIETIYPYSLLDKFQIEKLFRGDNFSTSRSDKGLAVTASESGDVSWTFANSVIAVDSRVLIKGNAEKDDFSALKVTFTDAENDDIAVTVNVINGQGTNASILFGDADRTIPQGFALSDNTFEIGYNGTKFYVGNVRVNVSEDDLGKAFNGFPSGRVYISVAMCEAEKGASYTLEEIDNQKISNLSSDRVAPRIAINGEYGGLYNVGDEYVLNSALVSDAIDPSASATLTVRSPSGAIVKDVNGVELKNVSVSESYKITLTEVGQYSVYYLATDNSDNEEELTYAINLIDKVAPTVKIGKAAKIAKVGDKYTFPKVTVTDDVTTQENLIVYLTVRNPEGVLIRLGDITEEVDGVASSVRYDYTFAYEGEYTLMVLAMDEAGNQTLAKFVVTVSK